jgi:uncharacterized protein YfdQ (DUF2303 family)
MNENTEARAIAAIVRENQAPIFKQPQDHGTSAPLLLWPHSERLESLERLLPLPTCKRATVKLTDYQSFIAYVQAHKLPGTHIFAELTPSGGSFKAFIDYHDRNATVEEEGRAHWGKHTVKLDLQYSPELTNWIGKNGKPMDQVTMANFLEENRLDIKAPDAATVIEIAHTFEATQGVNFKSAQRLQSGDRSLFYDVTTGAKAGQKGDLTIPEMIGLSMPIFTNDHEYEINAFFRYDISGGSLKLRYEMIRLHKVIELAIAETRNAIEQQTGIPVHSGNAVMEFPT